MLITDLYKEIFATMLVIEHERNKENNFCSKINFIKTATKIKQKYHIKKKIINSLLLKYQDFNQYANQLLPIQYLLNSISNDIINNSKVQKILNEKILNKIEQIYKEYQNFDYDIQGRFFSLEVSKEKETPIGKLQKNLQKHGLQSLTNILINEGIEPIKTMFSLENNQLLVHDVNTLTNNLPTISNLNNKNLIMK